MRNEPPQSTSDATLEQSSQSTPPSSPSASSLSPRWRLASVFARVAVGLGILVFLIYKLEKLPTTVGVVYGGIAAGIIFGPELMAKIVADLIPRWRNKGD